MPLRNKTPIGSLNSWKVLSFLLTQQCDLILPFHMSVLAEKGGKWKLKFKIESLNVCLKRRGRSTECLEWESLVSGVRSARWCALHPFFLT